VSEPVADVTVPMSRLPYVPLSQIFTSIPPPPLFPDPPPPQRATVSPSNSVLKWLLFMDAIDVN
ncbi:hypothetical protein BgiMline_001192, partial [Biomphalaria glabrata]